MTWVLFIWGPPERGREIIGLTEQVHLDITHYDQAEFRNPRELRLHPWMGPTLFNCQMLHDPQHFLDFTQASVRGQFMRSEYALRRARQQVEHARQIWMGFYNEPPADPGPTDFWSYLHAIEHATNGVASLRGEPLTDRRLAIRFKERADRLERPGLYPALLGMLGAPRTTAEEIVGWLPIWDNAFGSLAVENLPPRLHPARQAYYRRAFDALLASPEPMAVLWPLLRTWTLMMDYLADGDRAADTWYVIIDKLGFREEAFGERIAALDAYLDNIEETLEIWARQQGITNYP